MVTQSRIAPVRSSFCLIFRRDLGKHNRDVIAYCEKELNQSAPETNSLVQILFDKNIQWAYLDAEKILLKNTSQFVF